jgi:anaerobic magnesium-protoporphyrin IX monomethyl ester cyclase
VVGEENVKRQKNKGNAMKILLINPSHLSIGSRLPREHLPPLGLLYIGGGLIDAGYEVNLLDADYGNMKVPEIATSVAEERVDVVMLGHSGSTSAQPIINEITQLIKQAQPEIHIIIGGVFPTFHWKDILQKNPQIDYIVCGEGEKTIVKLIDAIKQNSPISEIRGIAYRKNNVPTQTPPAEVIENLDECRIAWELMNGYHYTYWGKRKAVVVQFSRGCPHRCTYCGQSLFWQKFRHRNPQIFADEIEMLHKTYGIEVLNFADENPASDADAWKAFLEALIAKKLPLILVGSIRADNIVRDADILHLYKQAGFERFLLGIENYDEAVLAQIKKAGTVSKDRQAIQLLRKHDILSMATYVVGFGEERVKDFWRSLKQLFSYDPDQIQLLYVTPHRWTPYFEEVKDKEIILTDQRKWDYKHQVIATQNMCPTLVILCVKFIELFVQMRPKSVKRLLFHRDIRLRSAMRWYTNIGRRVWFWELYQFFFVTKLTKEKVTLENFWDSY